MLPTLASYCPSCHVSCSSCSSPDPCVWSPWSWGPCSATCGPADQVGTRTLLRGGEGCPVSSVFQRSCVTTPCPVDCAWSDWSLGSCSVTCGSGRRIRTRSKERTAGHGGTDCSGDSYSLGDPCIEEDCPVNCEWSSWSWSGCSVTCGIGERIGTRTVDLPRAGQGRDCSGDRILREPCTLPACCNWGTWSEWSVTSDVLVLARDGAGFVERRSSEQTGGEHCNLVKNQESRNFIYKKVFYFKKQKSNVDKSSQFYI